MSREILTLVVPLLLPTVVYLLWLRTARWSAVGHPVAWHKLPWVWLALSGVMLTAAVLVVVTVGFGTAMPGIYVPPQIENGQIVPGHIKPGKQP
ncbi:MAG TPA: DUF6111 family protein [Stellaceae bacterium]|jgi:hypothetical protein|nr:DUF6111 family protein [Stellaceae bacterium]